MTLMPYVGAFEDYAASGGLHGKPFNASFAFILVFMDVLVTIYMIVSLRTNLVFFLIFITLIPTFGCLTGFYFGLSRTPPDVNVKMLHAGGALAFVTSMLGWYIFLAILLASVDFPFSLPGKRPARIYSLHILLTLHSRRSFPLHQGRLGEGQHWCNRSLSASFLAVA